MPAVNACAVTYARSYLLSRVYTYIFMPAFARPAVQGVRFVDFLPDPFIAVPEGIPSDILFPKTVFSASCEAVALCCRWGDVLLTVNSVHVAVYKVNPHI